MVKYANLPNLADVFFGLFLVSWIVTRQLFFPAVIYSVIFTSKEVLDYKWDPASGWFYNVWVQVGFASLLVGLQAIMCMWLYMILRVVVKVLRGESADDVRSDSESVYFLAGVEDSANSNLALQRHGRRRTKGRL